MFFCCLAYLLREFLLAFFNNVFETDSFCSSLKLVRFLLFLLFYVKLFRTQDHKSEATLHEITIMSANNLLQLKEAFPSPFWFL